MSLTETEDPATTGATPPAANRRGGRWIEDWDPENETFWARSGNRVARRNLIWSILAEHVGFSVWLLWSAVVVYLPAAGFGFTVNQLFWLVALPNLVGATMRFPYTFAVARFGGRNWTVVSALLLLVPLALLTVCVANPSTPYPMFLLAAATAGLGGGNFASSMANISYFYPDAKKGAALGVNAAGGNIGVSTVQLVVPAIVGLSLVGTGGAAGLHLENIVLVWVPLALVATAGAWFFMDNLSSARSPMVDQLRAAARPQTWVMALLYVGTFGSFIGYGAAMPLLMKTQFPDVAGVYYAFLGALVGSGFRPLGGWLADRIGGARITAAVFVGMSLGVIGVIAAVRAGSFAAFVVPFVVLFALAGVGNGATYRMIPAIFRTQTGDARTARRHSAAALGLVSAIGAYGGFLVPRSFGWSVESTGGIEAALVGFIGFYAACTTVTWWFYLRRRLLVGHLPSLAHARV